MQILHVGDVNKLYLLNEQNELHNRGRYIKRKFVTSSKVNVDHEKANIEVRKANDESIKVNICEQLGKMIPSLPDKTVDHILRIAERDIYPPNQGRRLRL